MSGGAASLANKTSGNSRRVLKGRIAQRLTEM